MVDEEVASESSNSSGPEIDPEDPMRDYLVAKRKEEKGAKKGKKSKSKNKHKDETPEERRARKERKRLRKGKGKSAGMKGVEDLLNSLGGGIAPGDQRHGSVSPRRSRSGSPVRDQDRDNRRLRRSPTRRRSRSHERPPRRARSPTRSPPYRSRDAEDRRQHEREGDSPPRARRGYD